MLQRSLWLLALTSASVVQGALTLLSPSTLTTCQPASFNWTGGLPYYILNVGPQGNTNAEQYTLTTKAYDWLVDYPAGTIVNVRLDSGAPYGPTIAYSGSMVVQPGIDSSCVPTAKASLTTVSNPITFTTVPTNLSACDAATWSWAGGAAPYTVSFIPLDSAGMIETHTTNAATYTWAPTFPGGVTVYMTVAPSSYTNSQQVFSKTMYIYNGTSDACVTAEHAVNATKTSPPPYVPPVSASTTTRKHTATATQFVSGNRPDVASSLSGGAIGGIVGGIVALGLIYLGYFIVRRRQQRNMRRFGHSAPTNLLRLDSIEVESENRPVLGGRGAGGSGAPGPSNAPAVLRR